MPQIKKKSFCYMLWKMKTIFQIQLYFLIACEVCMCMLLRKEWGVRVCGDVILFDFWCSFAEIFFKLPYWDFTKSEAVCDIYVRNFWVISMRFAVFLWYSVGWLYIFLCSFVVLVSPLRPPWESQRRWQIE